MVIKNVDSFAERKRKMDKRLYFISADIEGVTDVTSWSETEKGQDGYEAACLQMTKEVAAACEAILEAGHEAVVRDGHGTARNLIHDMLPQGVRLMRGWACHPASMMAGIDEKYAGALYIGYHSPAGSDESPLAHTTKYENVASLEINGRLASEFTLNSLYAAQQGVPSIFISGDAGICRRAKEEIPDIVTVPVKECRGNSTFNIHPRDAVIRIKEGVAEALAAPAALLKLPDTFEMRVRLKKHQLARAALGHPGVRRMSEDTVACTVHSPAELSFMFGFIIG